MSHFLGIPEMILPFYLSIEGSIFSTLFSAFFGRKDWVFMIFLTELIGRCYGPMICSQIRIRPTGNGSGPVQ
jgi:hypothetical protein